MNTHPHHSVRRPSLFRAIGFVALSSLAAMLGACNPPSSEQGFFPSPDAAVDAAVKAVRTDNESEIKRIFGDAADEALKSGDSVADANRRATFLAAYDEKHKITPAADGSMTLEVGNTDWPMPIPIVKGDKGWYFDTEAGLDEILSRRIGRNELDVIQTCLAIADAQRDYVEQQPAGDGVNEYAQKIISDTGKKNGLYWPSQPGEVESPLGDLVASAAAEGYGGNRDATGLRPYHGYYYRLLTSQGPDATGGELSYMVNGRLIGGFGLIAWPADYANSGLKSFMVSHHGVVYEKDLGDDTDRVAKAMTSFNPGPGWVRSAQ